MHTPGCSIFVGSAVGCVFVIRCSCLKHLKVLFVYGIAVFFLYARYVLFTYLSYPQAPCDNGSKIQNYILQWDEVCIYLKHQFGKGYDTVKDANTTTIIST